MTTRQPRYSAEETARRGDTIYERDIRAQVEPTDRGKSWPSTLTMVRILSVTMPSLRRSASSLNTQTPKSGACVSALECYTISADVP
jgi:hypothetical protein